MKKENFVTGGAVLAAFGASLCCIGPILFVLLGIGAFGAATVLASARPYLLGAAVLALAFGFYRASFRRETCAPVQACATESARPATRINLWLAALAVLVFALSPYYVGTLARYLGTNPQPAQRQITTQHFATVRETLSATPTPDQSPRPYSTDLSALRSQFNRDKGKVRLVTLLSPT